MNRYKGGFTIVELLIVIVVIAILAAITIVAFNGIQQRANNAAIISAASQAVKSIRAYNAQEGDYPLLANYACVTTVSGCVEMSGTSRGANSIFDTNMVKISSLSRSVPSAGSVGNGIIYNHTANRELNGQSRPALLMYFLNGQNQKCGISDVMSAWGTPGQEASTSATGYTTYNSTHNKTVCLVSI